jgi:hypothetical protein
MNAFLHIQIQIVIFARAYEACRAPYNKDFRINFKNKVYFKLS